MEIRTREDRIPVHRVSMNGFSQVVCKVAMFAVLKRDAALCGFGTMLNPAAQRLVHRRALRCGGRGECV